MEGSEPPWERAAQDSLAAVEAALRRQDLTPRLREWLEMVKAVALGYPLSEIARWSHRTERTVEHWLHVFAANGITALADAPRSGRPARAQRTRWRWSGRRTPRHGRWVCCSTPGPPTG
jgi:hypothetical protein